MRFVQKKNAICTEQNAIFTETNAIPTEKNAICTEKNAICTEFKNPLPPALQNHGCQKPILTTDSFFFAFMILVRG